MGYNLGVELRPVACAFSLFGVFWGSWAVAAADLERALHLSAGGFGLLLSLALLGGAMANAFGGAACERFGTGRVLVGALGAWAVLLAAAAAAQPAALLGLALVLLVVAAGLVDVTMNVAATASLADRPGRLVAFHAWFNGGAAAGAALTGGLLAAGLSWRWAWAGTALAAGVLALTSRRARLPAGGAGDGVALSATVGLLRRQHLVVLALAFVLAAMVEGGVDLWGVLYLRTHLASGLLLGAGGAVLGYTVAALARSMLGPLIGARGAGRGVAIGAGTALVGLVVLVAAPSAIPAALGLVLAAGGISMCWPLLVAQASGGRERAGAAIGAVSAGGYLGLVLGPTLVGWTAEAVGLLGALGLLAAAAAIVALLPVTSRSFGLAGQPSAAASELPA